MRRPSVPGPLLLCALLPPVLLWPMPLVWYRALITSPLSEGMAHLWGWWVALEEASPFRIRTALLNYPDGLPFELIDPLHLIPYGLFGWISPAAGFNAVLWLGLFVSGVAGWLLAKEAGAEAEGQILGACIGVSCPTLLCAGVDGITEGLGVGWVGLQLALLLRFVRSPTPTVGVLVAASMVAGVHAGPYNGVWMLLVDVPVGVWALRQTRWHLAVAGVALALTVPFALALASRSDQLPGGGARAGVGGMGGVAGGLPVITHPWRGGNQQGADLLDLFVPAPLTGAVYDIPNTAYLGVVTLGLAAYGLWKTRRWAWGLGALGFVMLALGPWLVVGGDLAVSGDSNVLTPTGWLAAHTPLGRMTRFIRAGAVALLLLIPLASRAVTGRAALVAAGLVLFDARFLSPVPTTFPTVESAAEVALAGLEGPIAEVPSVHPLYRDDHVADENLLLQISHGQPTTGAIHGYRGGATHHRALRTFRRFFLEQAGPRDSVRIAANELADLGYRWLVVYRERLPVAGRGSVEEVLGAAVAESDRVVVYRLR